MSIQRVVTDGVEVFYAYCKPEDWWLAIPEKPQPVQDIIRNFPMKAKVAMNIMYHTNPPDRTMQGYPLGLMYKQGRSHPSYADKALEWPVFWVGTNDVAYITHPTALLHLHTARVACQVGPSLVAGGETVTAYELQQQIRDEDYTGLNPLGSVARKGIGITEEGLICEVAAYNCSLLNLAKIMVMLGCERAVANDGGGSVCFVSDDGTSRGLSDRKQPCASVMTNTVRFPSVPVEEEDPGEPPSQKRELIPPGLDGFYFYMQAPRTNVSKNFTWSEFRCRGTGRVLIAEYLLDMVQYMRDKLGGPLHITSAYRSPSYNNRLQGASEDSFHTLGMAVDVSIGRWGRQTLISLARDFGWKGGLGLYPTFVHFDIGPERSWGS